MASSSERFIINDLPKDLLLEILSKLPLKPIHTSKAVCKLWLSLISHPSFRRDFMLRSPYGLTLHYSTHINESWSENSSKEFSLDFLIPPQLQCYLCSSNGLVLCCRSDHPCKCVYYVCNPLTKQWVTLPLPPTCNSFVLTGIVCDLGYKTSTCTSFKVVRIVSNTKVIVSDSLDLEIFDSVTSQWKVSTITCGRQIVFCSIVDATEFRGVLHWESDLSDVIVAFDPSLEQCRVIEIPDSFETRMFLGVSQGELYCLKIFVLASHHQCAIWKLDNYETGEWCLHCKFAYRTGITFDESRWQAFAIDPTNANNYYICIRNKNKTYKISEYNSQTKKASSLCDLPHIYSSSVRTRMVLTFVPPSWPTLVPRISQPSISDFAMHSHHS